MKREITYNKKLVNWLLNDVLALCKKHKVKFEDTILPHETIPILIALGELGMDRKFTKRLLEVSFLTGLDVYSILRVIKEESNNDTDTS